MLTMTTNKEYNHIQMSLTMVFQNSKVNNILSNNIMNVWEVACNLMITLNIHLDMILTQQANLEAAKSRSRQLVQLINQREQSLLEVMEVKMSLNNRWKSMLKLLKRI